MYARLGPRGSKTTMSAVAVRGTVEMLSAPERVKVSTDGPSQPSSLSLAGVSEPQSRPHFPLRLFNLTMRPGRIPRRRITGVTLARALRRVPSCRGRPRAPGRAASPSSADRAAHARCRPAANSVARVQPSGSQVRRRSAHGPAAVSAVRRPISLLPQDEGAC